MEDLIKALTILNKYLDDGYNKNYPTACEHDELIVCVDPEKISEEDMIELNKLGFMPSNDYMISYRFGSC